MRASRGVLRIALFAVFLTLGLEANAGERVHAVRPGESASSIAKRYYGDTALGDVLLRYNDRGGTVIRPGEKLRIPWCEVHEVGKGDSWSTLATKYLGSTQAYPTLAALNGHSPVDVLRLGEKVVIPVVLSYKLERGDALAPLADRFYGDPEFAGLLQEFNAVSDPHRLSVGTVVKIPLVSIRLKGAAGGTSGPQPAGDSVAPHPPPARAEPVKIAASPASGEKPTPDAPGAKAPGREEVSPPKPGPEPAVASPPAGKASSSESGGSEKAPDTEPKEPSASLPGPEAADPNGPGSGGATRPTIPEGSSPGHAVRPGSESLPKDPGVQVSRGTDTPIGAPPASGPVAPPARSFGPEIREASRAFADGEYARARRILESLSGRATGAPPLEKADIWRLLAYVYVAYDMRAEACEAYRALSRVTPNPDFNPDLVSPKIRNTLTHCPVAEF